MKTGLSGNLRNATTHSSCSANTNFPGSNGTHLLVALMKLKKANALCTHNDQNSQIADVNCFKNLTSFSLKRRISLMPYFSIAGRSIPIPKANPEYLAGSILQFWSTFGCTIPQPRISTQPVFLQILQPSPPHIKQLTSISALGSVNGK